MILETLMEVGQRMFLYAMGESWLSEDRKLQIAQMMLRGLVSTAKDSRKLAIIQEHSYKFALRLRHWQMKQASHFVEYLTQIQTDPSSMDLVDSTDHPDQAVLVEWLNQGRKDQNSVKFLTHQLVTPCLFATCGMDAGREKFKQLFPDESLESSIDKHAESHWGLIWERSDHIMALRSFRTNIDFFARRKSGASLSPTAISTLKVNLARQLEADIRRLIKLFDQDINTFHAQLSMVRRQKKEAQETYMEAVHEAGVQRVKKAQVLLDNLHPPSDDKVSCYLYNPAINNEEERKHRSPTLDDALHIIYEGVDPNGVCRWKAPVQELIHYYFPSDGTADSRASAWHYACVECASNTLSNYAYIFGFNRTLALPAHDQALRKGDEGIMLKAMIQTDKTALPQGSALNSLGYDDTRKTKELFQQIHEYYALAVVMVNPEYRSYLSFRQQLICVLKNFMTLTKGIKYERLESVQIFIEGFRCVLDAQDIESLSQARCQFKQNYHSRREAAHSLWSSNLYDIVQKYMDGPDAVLEKNATYQLIITGRKSTA